jgi:hypothetical protein
MASLRLVALLLLCLVPLAGQAQAGPRVRAETEAVVRAVLPVAQEMLLAHGEFAPFGMGLANGNEVVDIAPPPARDRGDPADPVSLLRQGLADAMRSGSVRATALAYEARINLPGNTTGDGIAIALAHRDNFAAIVVYPYVFKEGRVVLGEPHLIEQKPPARAPKPRRK